MKFCLAYEIRVVMVLPHHNQAKKSKCPKMIILASPGENVQFFVYPLTFFIFKLLVYVKRSHRLTKCIIQYVE